MVATRRVGAVLVVAVLLVTAACSGGGSKKPSGKTEFPTYVAMGDSSVAGPSISPADTKSGACARSKDNWPSYLALALNVKKIEDISCSGAVAADILTARPEATAAQPHAQLDAVTADTDLVTISIGGNDEGVFSKVTLACLAGSFATDQTCASFVDTKLGPILARTTASVASALDGIRKKAPKARIVLVGYLRIIPTPDGCTVPGISAARTRSASAAWSALEKALASAAEQADVDFVSMADKSVGHESCTGDKAWVNGLQPTGGDGAVLHPNAAGMAAVAKIVAQHLSR